MSYNEGIKSFIAYGAVTAHSRVKLRSGYGDQVQLAGAGEAFIGVAEYAVADGEYVSVKLKSYPGTVEMIAAGAVTVGAAVYGAANGKVDDAASGNVLGYALEAATADGDIIEVLPMNVLSTTAATVSIDDTGTFTTKTTVEAALAEIYQHILTAQGSILVPLAAITQEDGTPLAKLSSTASGFAQISNAEQVIHIPASATIEAFGFSTPIPLDLDDAKDITVHVLAGKTANDDSITLDCEVYPCIAGDVGNADIQDTAAQTITQAASELTFTCGADGVLAAPGTLSVVLTIGGTNDQDAVYIYGAWIEYSKKILTA